MDEDSDRATPLEVSGSRTFSPSRRPSYQPWTRTNTSATGFQRASTETLSRTNTEPALKRQRSRQFSQTSVDTNSILLDKRAYLNASDHDGEDSQQWHSIALLFVALPALAGMFFENGSAVVTDMLMLGLGCLFLYWSVKWPWQWYHSTQEMKLAEMDPNAEFAVVDDEEDENEGEATNDAERPDSLDGPKEKVKAPGGYPGRTHTKHTKRAEAARSLQQLELMALSSCFISPAAVAYMLHAIRPYLSRPSGGLVSNSNLTLFVLAAELRPILHFFRLVEERTLHLQRIVSTLPASDEKQLEDRVEALCKRLEELDNRPPSTGNGSATTERNDKQAPPTGDSSDVERSVRQSLQPQLDALNRAVRRYEKRATTQAIVTEARLQDLEARLKDALSLAAAASRNSERSGLLGTASDVVKFVLTKPLEAVRQIVLLPFELAGEVWRFLVGPRRKKRRNPGTERYTGDFKGKQRLEAR